MVEKNAMRHSIKLNTENLLGEISKILESINQNEITLFNRFNKLNYIWWGFLKRVATITGFEQKEGEKIPPEKYIEWINDKLEIGPTDIYASFLTQTLLKDFHFKSKNYEREKNMNISDEILRNYNFNDECFKKVFANMLQYISAVSELYVPEKLTEFCKIPSEIINT